VAVWSIITSTSFVDVLDAAVAGHPDKLEVYLQAGADK